MDSRIFNINLFNQILNCIEEDIMFEYYIFKCVYGINQFIHGCFELKSLMIYYKNFNNNIPMDIILIIFEYMFNSNTFEHSLEEIAYEFEGGYNVDRINNLVINELIYI